MRQDNKEFVSILNRIRTCEQTTNNIAYLNKHCYKCPRNDRTFPYRFHLNKDVQQHNEKKLSFLNFEPITLKTYDNKIDSIETNNYGNKKMNFLL